MTTPMVSVVLPVRNAGVYLDAAVDSILGQTLRDLELLVVDDGSTDDAVQRVPADPRLRVLRRPARGVVEAANTGLAHARAPYIARMDSDDLARPERLERQVAMLEAQPDLDIVGGQVAIFTDNGPPAAGFQRYEGWVNGLTSAEALAREMFVESPIPNPTAVVRREVFQRIGGYRDTAWAEDYDLWLRAWHAGIRMAKPEGVLLDWRDGPARHSRTHPRYSDEQFIRARAHFLAHSAFCKGRFLLWGAGRYGARLADALAGEGVAPEAFVDVDPRKLGGIKRGKPVIAVDELPAYGDVTVIAAVRTQGAHDEIRQALNASRRREGEDYLLAG